MAIAKRILLPLMGTLLFLVTLEIGLRMEGREITTENATEEEIRPEDANAVRILTLGDSMTMPYPGKLTWPRMLEKKLRDGGLSARVYNRAQAGAGSSLILDRLPEDLDRYRPQIVITMMTALDTNISLIPFHPRWYDRLRVVKLARALLGNRKSDRASPQTWLPPKDFGDPQKSRDIVAKLKRGELSPAESLLAEQLRPLSADERAQYYYHLAREVGHFDALRSPETPDNFLAIDLIRRSLAAKFQPGMAGALAYQLSEPGHEDECLDLAHRVIATGEPAADLVMTGFSWCAETSWRTDSRRKNEWREVLQKLSGGRISADYLDRRVALAATYHQFAEILASRHVVWIAMQYPTLKADEIKRYFLNTAATGIDSRYANVHFAENRENFATALAHGSYEDFFTDHEGDTFGHCTEAGHTLIADTAYAAVRDALPELSKR